LASECDEYIQNVQLESLNNTSGCNYYTDYSTSITYLQRGASYTLTVVPQIVGQNPGMAYIGDEIAAWIDYNHDFVFDPATERIAFVSVVNGWSNQFNFNVPQGASLGETWLRVRISYNGEDGGEGPINPCGNTQYGEVEDYRVHFTDENLGVTKPESHSFEVNPNPGSTLVTLHFSEEIDVNKGAIYILSAEGKVVQIERIQTSFQTQINVQQLAPGTYFIQLSDGAKTSYKRFIKQ
jgi:lysyl endopeptidase